MTLCLQSSSSLSSCVSSSLYFNFFHRRHLLRQRSSCCCLPGLPCFAFACFHSQVKNCDYVMKKKGSTVTKSVPRLVYIFVSFLLVIYIILCSKARACMRRQEGQHIIWVASGFCMVPCQSPNQRPTRTSTSKSPDEESKSTCCTDLNCCPMTPPAGSYGKENWRRRRRRRKEKSGTAGTAGKISLVVACSVQQDSSNNQQKCKKKERKKEKAALVGIMTTQCCSTAHDELRKKERKKKTTRTSTSEPCMDVHLHTLGLTFTAIFTSSQSQPASLSKSVVRPFIC